MNNIFEKTIIELVTIGNEFCKLVETAKNFSAKKFVENTNKILALLYSRTILIETEISDDNVEKFVSEADWVYVRENISVVLGEHEQFFDIRQPFNNEGEADINLALSEAIADIYQDVKDFTSLYNLGSEEAIKSGMGEFINNFRIYWGPRVLGVMTITHNMINDDFEW